MPLTIRQEDASKGHSFRVDATRKLTTQIASVQHSRLRYLHNPDYDTLKISMAAVVQDDLYKPLSADFLVPTNRDIGAISLHNGGTHRDITTYC